MRRKSAAGKPAETYDKLRQLALDAVTLGLGPPPEEHPEVSGVVVDVPGSGGGWATLVVMHDGTTSMYTSTGGGTLGGGAHPSVAAASNRLLRMLNVAVSLFPVCEGSDHPPEGRVRWFVLTPAARRAADMPEDVFWGKVQHPTTPLAMAAQAVVTALRQA